MTRPKPIAVFDIDGTIFRSSLLIEVTKALIAAKIFPDGAEDLFRIEHQNWLNREGSYEEYLEKLIEAFTRHIKGAKAASLEVMADAVISHMSRQTYRYTRDLMKSLGESHFLVAISGSPDEMVSRFCEHYGFDDFRAAVYEVKDGAYTGEVRLAHTNKDKIVMEMVEKHNLTLAGSVGVGDSESDAAFLRLVEKPIAFNPNSALFTEAVKNDWQIVVERKDVIYHYSHGSAEVR